MKAKSILLLGCGDIGSELGLRLQAQGSAVLAVRRNVARLPAALPSLSMDYTDAASCQALQQWSGDMALMTPTPMPADAGGYRRGYVDAVANLLSVWADGAPKRLVFVSSTRVYGDCRGQWVDECSELQPDDVAGGLIAEAEKMLLDSPHEVVIVRCGGIYGRLPSRLLRRLADGLICPQQPVHYTNRIHRDDCIGFLQHLLLTWQAGQRPQPVYLAVDDAPASRWEVESWLVQQMGVQALEQTDTARRGSNKRCRNTRLRDSGYQLIYPDYRAGYQPMLNSTV